MPLALITGASAGIGAEFARHIARAGGDLILVARSEHDLESIAAEVTERYGVSAQVLVADLTDDASISAVAERLADASDPIDLLVNDAGFGLPLEFADNAIDAELAHLRIHVEAPMRLMHAALRVMRQRGGRIINVASVAAFLPRSTYAASKRWIVAFSEWANVQYSRDGVSVTALCPGFTHTQFHERMGLAPGEEGVPGWMWLSASRIVRTGLRDAARGRALSIPSLRYRTLVFLARVLPPRLLARLAKAGRI